MKNENEDSNKSSFNPQKNTHTRPNPNNNLQDPSQVTFQKSGAYKKRPLLIGNNNNGEKTFPRLEAPKLAYVDSADYSMRLDAERKVNQAIQMALYEQIKLAQSKFPGVPQNLLASKLSEGSVDNAELLKRAQEILGELQDEDESSLPSGEQDKDDQEGLEASKEERRKAIFEFLEKMLNLNKKDSAEYYMKVDLLKKFDQSKK